MTTTRDVTTPGAKETVLVVVADGREVGMVTQWKGKGQPWKATRGVGADATFLRAFYPADGGKRAAVGAVYVAAQEADRRDRFCSAMNGTTDNDN